MNRTHFMSMASIVLLSLFLVLLPHPQPTFSQAEQPPIHIAMKSNDPASSIQLLLMEEKQTIRWTKKAGMLPPLLYEDYFVFIPYADRLSAYSMQGTLLWSYPVPALSDWKSLSLDEHGLTGLLYHREKQAVLTLQWDLQGNLLKQVNAPVPESNQQPAIFSPVSPDAHTASATIRDGKGSPILQVQVPQATPYRYFTQTSSSGNVLLHFPQDAIYLISRDSGQTDTVYVNGLQASLPQQVKILEQRAYLPVRSIFELVHTTFEWQHQQKKLQFQSAYHQSISWTISEPYFVTGQHIYSDWDSPQLIDHAIFVPVRTLLYFLDKEVFYEATTKAIYIY
ncbi:stalk domain-containing protein [Marinicrinis sediminis]|uniref:Stalk domain-containing protein n=1 Tax=Marinicrinis sediminis TaxID=1652465 RepID=A0ABW5R6Q3_9BACL